MSLAAGAELVGEYLSSGCAEPPYLVRRGDGRMVELSHLLYLVASNLDGLSDLSAVAGRVGAELDRPIGPGSVEYLIDHKLRPLGLIAGDGCGGAVVGSRPATLGLTVRTGVIPPSVVRACTGVLRPLFLPPVVVAALVAWAVVDGWLVSRAGRGMAGVASTPSLVLALVGITLAAGLLHELGHATASRYGGAEPGVIGAGIYLIWPVFYNDLNDSYRLDRRGRLRADLGGVYFNVLVVVLLAALYRLSGWAPLVVAVAVQHVAIGQQFLPFVRLDGYYVVSDAAGVPDLFARIRPILTALLPGRPLGPGVAELTRRARTIVTVWVLATVPLLVGCVALAVVTLPSVLRSSALALRVHARVLAQALGAAAFGRAALNGVELAALVVPFVGLGAVAMAIVAGCRRRARRRRSARSDRAVADRPEPRGPTGSPANAGTGRPGRARLTLGGALVLLVVCATSTSGRRRQRQA